jgi:amino acid adenylation domain-containing protein
MALHEDALALRYRGMSVSYAEFSDRAASVASFLHRSYGDGGRIAVLLERSPEMFYALHGILHSGNAYVPMGIDWPPERIQTILEDIEPAAVITQESQKLRLAGAKAPIHTVESLASGYGRGAAFPDARIAPTDSMYILFTSGTTGKPKGADLPHRAIVNRLAWMQEEFRLLPGEKVLLNTPYTFDISGWQIFWPFMAGAAVAICEEGQHRDPRAMLRLIDSESVRIATFVPSMLSHFLPVVPQGSCPSLRNVVSAGEALSVELAARFFETLPGAALHNTYGPTETAIDICSWACSRADIERGTLPIGRPLPNCRTYVLDKRTLAICPPLVEGELYLGGVQLAKSYWKREEITAKVFIPAPLGNEAFGAGPLYKTGDACRYGLDGAIEYLGRLDDQLKIRGVRVESGEIETRVKAVPGVKNAALKKGATPSGEECLIVYYSSDAEIDPAAFRAELGKHVLASTIPEYYLRLDALPMSENGKLNRKALPDVAPATEKTAARDRSAEGGEFAEGDDPVERGVEAAWKKVLRVQSIPHDRNFFDAGGHSLSLLDLRAELEREFKKEIPIAELFARPSIADMAGLFRTGKEEADGALRARAERARASIPGRRPPEREKGGNKS